MPRFVSPFPADIGFGVAPWRDEPSLLMGRESEALGPLAVEKRRAEFVAGRVAGRTAMAQIGLPPSAILRGEDRAPCWPAGVVGAITHSADWALAAAGSAERYLGLGLDLERIDPAQNQAVGRYFTDAHEQAWIAGDTRKLITVFSAKEAIFKALYPCHGRYFDYDAVTTRQTAGGLLALTNQSLGSLPAGTALTVRVDHLDQLVLTSVVVLRAGSRNE